MNIHRKLGSAPYLRSSNPRSEGPLGKDPLSRGRAFSSTSYPFRILIPFHRFNLHMEYQRRFMPHCPACTIRP